jgi:hypothetical protein
MRKLLLDTDILLILSGLDLFDTAMELFEVERAQAYVLDAVQYQVKGKKFQAQYGEEAINRLRLILPNLKIITEISEPDNRILRTLSSVEEIDPGEALLVAKAVADVEAILLSGDKRWIRALCKSRTKAVKRIKNQLKEKVVSLEHLLVALLNSVDFETLAIKVHKSKITHITLRILFPPDIIEPESHCREGLLSYIGELEATTGKGFFYPL